jgi:hypothetical protein
MPLDKMNLQDLPQSVQSWFGFLINNSFYGTVHEVTVTVGTAPSFNVLSATYPLSGVRSTDTVIMNLVTALKGGLAISSVRPETDQISVRFINPTGTDRPVGDITLRFLIFKS